MSRYRRSFVQRSLLQGEAFHRQRGLWVRETAKREQAKRSLHDQLEVMTGYRVPHACAKCNSKNVKLVSRRNKRVLIARCGRCANVFEIHGPDPQIFVADKVCRTCGSTYFFGSRELFEKTLARPAGTPGALNCCSHPDLRDETDREFDERKARRKMMEVAR